MSTFALEEERSGSCDGLRTCATCHKRLPETPEFFRVTGSGRDYLRRDCKRCSNTVDKARRHRAGVLGKLAVEPLRELLLRLLAVWLAEDKRYDDFAESVGLRSRAFFRIVHENRHVQFDLADRVLTHTSYSMHDIYPEYGHETDI